jgi:hypothetical protein
VCQRGGEIQKGKEIKAERELQARGASPLYILGITHLPIALSWDLLINLHRFERFDLCQGMSSILPYHYKPHVRASIVVYLLQSMSMLSCDFPTSCSGRPVSCPFSPPGDVVMHVLPSISKVMSPQTPCKSTGSILSRWIVLQLFLVGVFAVIPHLPRNF